jgi:hypothetical protein
MYSYLILIKCYVMLIISLFLLFMIEYVMCELYFYTRKLIIIVNVD